MTMFDPQIEVICDGDHCGQSIYVGLCATAHGYDERFVEAEIKQAGWIVDGDRHFCEDCQESAE